MEGGSSTKTEAPPPEVLPASAGDDNVNTVGPMRIIVNDVKVQMDNDKLISWEADAHLARLENEAIVADRVEADLWRANMHKMFHREEGTHFVDAPFFQTFIGGCIAFNGLEMGVSVDHDLGAFGTFLEHAFTSIWTIEMIMRLKAYGCRIYFQDNWNRVDFLLAWLSIMDAWVLAFLTVSWLRLLSVLRLLRVARLARLVKVLRAFRELWLLVNGMINAIRLLFWVIVMLVLVVYIGAIFMAYIVGSECEAGGVYEEWSDCKPMFGTLIRTMYTLFQVITLESWSMAIARPVIEKKAWTSIFFVLFLFLTSFGLMNIVMGVIVEQTLKASEENDEKLQKQREESDAIELSMLRTIFLQADEDGGGTVNKSEFLKICEREDVQSMFQIMDMPVTRTALALRLFEVLDRDNEGQIEIGEFLKRAFHLKAEGRGLKLDQTLLLMDVRHLARRLARIERHITTAVPGYNSGSEPGTPQNQGTPQIMENSRGRHSPDCSPLPLSPSGKSCRHSQKSIPSSGLGVAFTNEDRLERKLDMCLGNLEALQTNVAGMESRISSTLLDTLGSFMAVNGHTNSSGAKGTARRVDRDCPQDVGAEALAVAPLHGLEAEQLSGKDEICW